MSKVQKLAVPAILSLAVALTTLGCSSEEGSDPEDNNVVYGDTITYQGETYPTIVIGTQTWFAKNLNYKVSGSKCYGEDGEVYVGRDEDNYESIYKTLSDAEIQANCSKYGRLYTWEAAMDACPAGWHLPKNSEWDALFRFVDGDKGTESPYESETAGRYLKAASGWNEGGNGQDTYGFAALPGGYGWSDGDFTDVGDYGYWWSASESDDNYNYAYSRGMDYDIEYAYWEDDDKSFLRSVRCVKD